MVNKITFFKNVERHIPCKSSNLTFDGIYVVNYNTIIAMYDEEGNLILDKHKYSPTTSKNQTYIRRYCTVTNEVDGGLEYIWKG